MEVVRSFGTYRLCGNSDRHMGRSSIRIMSTHVRVSNSRRDAPWGVRGRGMPRPYDAAYLIVRNRTLTREFESSHGSFVHPLCVDACMESSGRGMPRPCDAGRLMVRSRPLSGSHLPFRHACALLSIHDPIIYDSIKGLVLQSIRTSLYFLINRPTKHTFLNASVLYSTMSYHAEVCLLWPREKWCFEARWRSPSSSY